MKQGDNSVKNPVAMALACLVLSAPVCAQSPDEPTIGVQKTGQTLCWNTAGEEIDCAGTGQDGETQYGVTPPSPRCTNNGDGTITDHMTGLVWLADNSCFEPLTWAAQLQHIDTLASGSCNLSDNSQAGDWRAPNLNELLSVVDYSFIGDESTLKLGCGLSLEEGPVWSSTTTTGNTGFVGVQAGRPEYQNSSDGNQAFSLNTSRYFVSKSIRVPDGPTLRAWPVRGTSNRETAVVPVLTTGQTQCWSDTLGVDTFEHELTSCLGTRSDGEIQAGLPRPVPRFRQLQENMYQDRVTGLIWLDTTECFLPKTWSEALAVAAALFDGATSDDRGGDCGLLDGSEAGDWRVPNVNEALSLIEIAERRYGTIDVDFDGWSDNQTINAFGMPSEMFFSIDGFWTSTTQPVKTLAYQIGPLFGSAFGFLNKDATSEVLLVRDPQPAD